MFNHPSWSLRLASKVVGKHDVEERAESCDDAASALRKRPPVPRERIPARQATSLAAKMAI